MMLSDRAQFSHRIAFFLAYGAIPVDRIVCHRCSNARCCNPRHLYAGTHRDNTADTMAIGRQVIPPHGEDHHDAVLTFDDVRDIRRARAAGVGYPTLALKYGISKVAIRNAASGKTWKDVTPTDDAPLASVGVVRACARQLSDDAVRRIRALRASGMAYARIGAEHDIGEHRAYLVATRRAYKHVA